MSSSHVYSDFNVNLSLNNLIMNQYLLKENRWLACSLFRTYLGFLIARCSARENSGEKHLFSERATLKMSLGDLSG